MNHLESSFAGKNALWRYLIMIATVLAVSNTIGALPLMISIIRNPVAAGELASSPSDFTVLGLSPITAFIFLLIPFIVALAAFILLVRPLNGRSPMTIINGTGTFRWKKFFIPAAVWTGISIVYLFVSLKMDSANFSVNNFSSSLILLVIVSVLLVPFQAAFEEILFRGYFMQGFTVIFRNRLLPLVITSILFGLMHSLNPEVDEFGFLTMMPQYILFGLIFGVVAVMDDGIESAIGIHAANNVFLCIMVTNKSSALQTPAIWEQHSVQPWTEFVFMLIMGILTVLILRKIFNWGSFSLLWGKVEAKAENTENS